MGNFPRYHVCASLSSRTSINIASNSLSYREDFDRRSALATRVTPERWLTLVLGRRQFGGSPGVRIAGSYLHFAIDKILLLELGKLVSSNAHLRA